MTAAPPGRSWPLARDFFGGWPFRAWRARASRGVSMPPLRPRERVPEAGSRVATGRFHAYSPKNRLVLRVPPMLGAVSSFPEGDCQMAANSTSTAAKVETVTLRQLAETLSSNHDLPKKQVMGMLEDMVGTITKHLKKGARIRIGGLGILQVRKRPARMGRNPATGQPIKIKASKKVAFRAAKELKEAV